MARQNSKGLNAINLGLAGGIVWGVSLMLLTWISMGTGYGSGLLTAITKLYPGYSIDLSGSFIGLLVGFVDFFIFLYLIAYVYNWLESR
jgi:hypothetical protein